MIDLQFVDASNSSSKYKATIHITGKVGFNQEANEFMEIQTRTHFKVAFDKQSSDFKHIYLVDSPESPIAAKVSKAGKYYYLNLASVLTKMKVDYTGFSYSFTIEKSHYEGADMFILTRHKTNPRNQNEKEEGSDELNGAIE